MGTKQRKPTTPGQRRMMYSDFAEITKSTPEKSLVTSKNSSGGRNAHGHITSWWRGGGHKQAYRIVDFKRNKDGIPAKVAAIEYDPNRTCRIALLHYADGEKRYILAPKELQVGATVLSGDAVEPKVGNALPMRNVPPGIAIHNIEMKPGGGGKVVRGAGGAATISAKEGKYALVNLPSGEIRKLHLDCRCTIGQIGNIEHSSIKLGKAGRSRWLGRRPHVRGMAMNPIAHPMGGGEGRSGGGRVPVSAWGKQSKGGKTRSKKAVSSKFIIRRRPKVR